MNFIEVRLQLRSKEANCYTLELTCDGLLNGIPVGVRNARCELTLLDECLCQLEHSSADYGMYLAEQLFADQGLRDLFVTAYAQAGHDGAFRLWLDLPADSALQQVAWERILHPSSDRPICVEQQVLVARCGAMSSREEQDLPLRPTLNVLGVIANPVDLGKYECASIDSAAEREGFCNALASADASIRPTLLVSGGATTPTWEGLKRQLLSRSYHILYIACHGMKSDDQTYLVLEDEQGQVAFVPSAEIAHFIGHQLPPQHRPLLVFLASCYC